MNLCYTICFDPPGSGAYRQMAKMLGASIARTYFDGDFLIIRNTPEPIFLVEKAGIREHFVETPGMQGEQLQTFAFDWKTKARRFFSPDNYERILYLDADCLALRNLDHLLEHNDLVGSDWDIRFQDEPGRSFQEPVFNGYLSSEEMGEEMAGKKNGINAGTFAVRASSYVAVMEEWERIRSKQPIRFTKWQEQSAWNRLVLDASDKYGWTARLFEPNEIQFPLHLHNDWFRYQKAALLHCSGGGVDQRLKFMFGIYMQTFFHDPKSTVVNLLDM